MHRGQRLNDDRLGVFIRSTVQRVPDPAKVFSPISERNAIRHMIHTCLKVATSVLPTQRLPYSESK